MPGSEPYILFEIAGAHYAVRAEQVQQVEMLETLTRVPKAPDFVEGVTSVRGQVLPVVSLRSRFRMPPEPPNLRTRLIVIQLGVRRIAMLVDSAREFARIEPETIQPPPQGLNGPGVEYLEGVTPIGNRLVLIINLHRLFDDQEKETLAKTTAMEE